MTAHEIKIRVVIEKNEKQTLQQLVKRLEKFMKDEEKRSRGNLELAGLNETKL
jgi:Rad3-related DNA helicase